MYIYIYIYIYISARVTQTRRRPPANISALSTPPVPEIALNSCQHMSTAQHTCVACSAAVVSGAPQRLAFTRYCHHQYCMVYGIQNGGRWKGVYCAMTVQYYCNRVGFASGGAKKG